jgi:hypothetical protein
MGLWHIIMVGLKAEYYCADIVTCQKWLFSLIIIRFPLLLHVGGVVDGIY